jgi:sugar lactone lactonase YvrE
MLWLALSTILAVHVPSDEQPRLTVIGRETSGIWNGSASEIAAFHAPTRRLFVTDAKRGLRIIDLSDPTRPRQVALHAYEGLNSVAIHGDLVAIVRQPTDRTRRGSLELLTPDGATIAGLEVGFGPDMVCFTPDGRCLLVANEGEATADGTFDPEGSIGVVDLAAGVDKPVYRELGFQPFEGDRPALVKAGLHCVSPKASLAQDLEPEYIAVSPDGTRAFATLQENNAIAVIDLARGQERVARIAPLGFKDFSKCGLDASDRDGGMRIEPAPVWGLHQPDTVKCFEHGGELWLATANEGEERDRADVQEASRLSKLKHALDADLAMDERLGRLSVSALRGDENDDGVLDRIFCFGGRSASLWKVAADGSIARVWDSGSEIERRTAELMPACFNMDSEKGGGGDDRSDNRGPEPEGLEVATVEGRRILLVGLERTGGVMAWDITDPAKPTFLQWINPRDPAVRAGPGAGDVAPEGLLFIPAAASPSGEPLVVVCNEVSGTTTIMRLAPKAP